MKERPPILSDEQIDAAWPSEAGDGFPEHSVDTIDALTLELMRCAKVVAQAQRDADVEWYSKLEMQYLDDCREVNEMQIHQQAAQAIFNDLWSDCPHGRFKRLYCLCCIKELEAKYLEGK